MPEEQIFISYAHIDNEPLTADEEGWVTTLHRMLEVRLAQLLGERPKIWRDPQMAGNAPITDTLTERLGHSTYLIPIISPRYVKSEWCCRELETFYSRYREPRRIFKVVKTGIPHEQHPAPVRDSLSYVFFRVDPDSGRLREFRPRSPSTAEDFVAQLDDLAFDLYRQISEMSQPATGSQAGEEGRLTVYLAHTTYALQQQRDEIRRELLEHGYRVLPDCDLPLTRDELVAKVEDALDQCDLAIHLIGGAYGLVPEGSQSSVLELQEQLSAARTTGEFSRILYVPKECETDDDRQRRFLWRVEEDPVSQRRTEFLRSSLDELYQVIHEKLQELAARRAAPEEVEGGKESEVEASAARPAQIYILCDAEDLQAVEQLDQYLYDQDLEPVLPLFDGSPEELQEDHLRNLRSCDAVLLYQGAAREAWLRKARHEVENAAEFGRKRPFRAAALYVGPPHDPRKARVRSHSMTVIQAMDELNVEALDAFVQELKS